MNSGSYTCPRCDNVYRTGEALELHLHDEHNLRLFQAMWDNRATEIRKSERLLPGFKEDR